MIDTPPTTFIVADDHPLFRNALRGTIEASFPGAAIVEAGTLDDVLAAIDERRDADLVLFDLRMPGSKGFSGLALIRAQHPDMPVGVISGQEDAATARRVLSLGAVGFLPKSARPDTIRAGLNAMMAGEVFLPPALRSGSSDEAEEDLLKRLASLTPQQLRVLDMLGDGLLNKQIAHELSVSEATVKAHVSAILAKLGVSSRTQAVIAANRIDPHSASPQPAA